MTNLIPNRRTSSLDTSLKINGIPFDVSDESRCLIHYNDRYTVQINLDDDFMRVFITDIDGSLYDAEQFDCEELHKLTRWLIAKEYVFPVV